MDIIVERACGLDVHKDSVTACILTSKGKEIQTFPTTTYYLLELIDWIKAHKCTHVAMESTSVYWKPIVNILEAEEIEFLVVNPQHMKAVPGRKTDVKDAEWIAKLLRHGLLQASYIPNRTQRELRELVRQRRSITEERARHINRIQKVLEGANIKLGSVVSNIVGVSSLEMLRAIAAGNDNVDELANMARGKMRRKEKELKLALSGYIREHQRFMIKRAINQIDFLTSEIELFNEEITLRLAVHEEDIERLDSIPGIARHTAEQLLAELGPNVGKQFPSAAHMCSWTGLVPSNNESAGKRKSTKIQKGNKYLKSSLIEAAHSIRNSKNYLGAMYRRAASRKGKKRAAIIVAHAILRISYYLLTRKEMYVDLGADYFEKKREQSIVKHSLRRLESLGYSVELKAQITT